MYVDSTGALLPQETSAAQDAAATAKMIRFIVFIGFTFTIERQHPYGIT
jgi:hypothetical protein